MAGPSHIIRITADHFGLSSEELLGKSRKAPIVKARHIAMYAIRRVHNLTFCEIAELFNKADHTVAMHGCWIGEGYSEARDIVNRAKEGQ